MLPLTPHLIDTFLKVYLEQFLLPCTSCLTMKKKLQGIKKVKTTISGEIEQTPKPHITGMLELSAQEFKITMNNMRRILIN